MLIKDVKRFPLHTETVGRNSQWVR